MALKSGEIAHSVGPSPQNKLTFDLPSGLSRCLMNLRGVLQSGRGRQLHGYIGTGMWLNSNTVQFFVRRHTVFAVALFGLCLLTRWVAAVDTVNDFGIPQVAEINRQIRGVWQEYEMSASPPATEGEWCRRVHLDLIGRIPTVHELDAYLNAPVKTKRADLVKKLLYDDSYVAEYARHWTTNWTNLLIGRSGGTANGSVIDRAGLQKYLRDSFAQDKPYDRFVYELISADGSNTPGAAGFNGAVNFLIGKLDENAAQATADTSRIFLGMQVQCTQCHNHPFNNWKQAKFWEMNAFFRQTVVARQFETGTRMVRVAELTNQDFAGEGGQPLEAEIYYELRNGLLKVAYPVFVDGTEVGRSGFVSDVNRREELADLVVGSPYMSEAAVNRMWAHFLGYGFTKPVDDMRPDNIPSHPELLDYLAGELASHRFELKQLMQWIALSEPYSLSSRMTRSNVSDDPQMGNAPRFSHFYLRQMQAEQLYESLITATQAHKTRSSYEQQETDKNVWLQQFVSAFGTDEGGESTTFNGSIQQALMLFNGDLIKRATSLDQGGFLHTIASGNLSNVRKINYLYMAGLARRPTQQEKFAANQLLLARQGDVTAALQDIWWAILNSNEFILNH